MKELHITDLEAGQRFDKYLDKYLANAGKSFLYKMLRKKNITLNDKKANGSEKLNSGDVIKIFFKDETLAAFTGKKKGDTPDNTDRQKNPREAANRHQGYCEAAKNYRRFVHVLYEDKEILLVNKPKGILSQKADKRDVSMCEYITAYLVDSGALTPAQLETFHPGVCNRLDRNTSGILAAGKNVKGLQELSYAFAQRTLEKYYIALVAGEVAERKIIDAYLSKEERTNKVTVFDKPEKDGAEHIVTEYIPVVSGPRLSLVKIHLYTGKTHQIRAHMANSGYPLIGDYKYGNRAVNQYYKEKYNITSQLLHSCQLIIPYKSLNVTAPFTEEFLQVLKGENLWQRGIQEVLEALR